MNEKTEALGLALTRLTREKTRKCARGVPQTQFCIDVFSDSEDRTHVACRAPEFEMKP